MKEEKAENSGYITDYEHTEDEDDTQDEGVDPNAQGENAFLLFLSQNGNIVLDNDHDGKSDSGIEKEKKEANDETKDRKRAIKAVKDSAVGG